MPIKNLFRYWTFQVFSPGTVVREKYEAFKRLLSHDRQAHDHLARLEDIYYNRRRVDYEAVVASYAAYARSVGAMVDELLRMCPTGYWSLKDYHKKFDFYVRFMLAPPDFAFSPPFVAGLGRGEALDEQMAGGKAAALDRVIRELGLPVPGGFVITTRSFHYFMEANDLNLFIKDRLAGLDLEDPAGLGKIAGQIETAVLKAPVPEALAEDIQAAAAGLQQPDGAGGHGRQGFALRSSGVKEDGRASFAGQYLSLMNVGAGELTQAYKRIIASKYTAGALSYRIHCGIPDHEAPMAVLVLDMVDAQAAGVVYSRDFDSQAVTVYSAWGLGGPLVDGRVTPDVARLDRNGTLLERKIADKQEELVLDTAGGTTLVSLARDKRQAFSLEETDIQTLHRWAMALEDFFQVPQDMEWCRSRNGLLFLVQSRPLRQKAAGDAVPNGMDLPDTPICQGGITICRGRAAGRVFHLNRLDQIKKVPENSVVVTPFGLPQYVAAIHKMAGVILQSGSNAGHFASIAREFGVPALICDNGVDALEPGSVVTLDADKARVFEGRIEALLGEDTESSRAKDVFAGSILMDRLKSALRFCADLRLTDPDSREFGPDHCRSLHDILRFTHETAVQQMLFLGRRRGARKKGARQFVSGLPMLFYVLDVGREEEAGTMPPDTGPLVPDHLASVPMAALFKGLSHPDIRWDEASHFDWEAYDKIVMAGGIISADSPEFGSYAVVSKPYMNVNLRFGYHFVIIDSMCTPSKAENYILFRFSGGGGNIEGRWLRAGFIAAVLERLGFVTQMTADLIDGRFEGATLAKTRQVLDLTGRLMGATKLMDMYLKTDADIENLTQQFMAGQYDFRSVKE
jgi:pyruvate,water dikinase